MPLFTHSITRSDRDVYPKGAQAFEPLPDECLWGPPDADYQEAHLRDRI